MEESASCSSSGYNNGMTGIPAFQIGDFCVFRLFLFLSRAWPRAGLLLLACRMLVNSRHGRVMLLSAKTRCAQKMLGYDIRVRQWLVFVLAALLAALSGLLYVPVGAALHNPVPSRPALRGAARHLGGGGRARKTACGRHRYVCAQLIELPALLIRQPIRSRHHWRIACHRYGVFPERFGRPARPIWLDAVRSRPRRRQLEFAGSRWHDRSHPVDRRPEGKQFGGIVATDTMSRSTSPQATSGPTARASRRSSLFFAAFMNSTAAGSSSRGRTSPECCLLAGSGKDWGLTFQTNPRIRQSERSAEPRDSALASILRRTGNFG